MVTDRCFCRPRRGESRRPLVLNPAGCSARGAGRAVNQDRYRVDSQRQLFVVADGMGGMRGGERAAQMAVDLLPMHPALLGCETSDRDTIRALLAQAFLDINAEILSEGERDPRLHGMGTTAVLGMLFGDRLYLASVGDSRGYLLRGGDLHQYTIDHNMAQTLVTMGAITHEAARSHRWRHMLWKHLGLRDLQDGPDVVSIRLEPGDRVVLASDGVTEVLESRDIVTVLDSHASPSGAAEALVRSAVERGTRDDATSVVVNVVDAARCC
ncbi:MAG: PP2C family protein-serine/threonine phosphatase [Pirellulaceae bacterium]